MQKLETEKLSCAGKMTINQLSNKQESTYLLIN